MVQFIGNTKEASDFLAKCKRGNPVESIYGFGHEVVCDLYEWIDESGKKWTEFVQYEIWSSGPMIFTALKSEDDKVIGWKLLETFYSYRHNKEFDEEKGEIYI